MSTIDLLSQSLHFWSIFLFYLKFIHEKLKIIFIFKMENAAIFPIDWRVPIDVQSVETMVKQKLFDIINETFSSPKVNFTNILWADFVPVDWC